MRGGNDGKIVTPGKSAESELVISVARIDPKKAMPPRQRRERGGNRPGAPGGTSGTPTNAAAGTRPNMPPPAKPLTAEQVRLVRAWIDQGAK